ncbi:MAG: ERF family protein [Pseudomonadota bacterium]|nr:ERF family protein [Pseudomonadota bacterium]
MSEAPNIYQRLHAAAGEIKRIAKEKPKGLMYEVVTHDAVTAACKPVLLARGVHYHPVNMRVTQCGNRTEVLMDVRFVNIDKPDDFVDVPSCGYGIDPQDKGPGKAMSYAVKFALLKALGLETGEDADLEQPANHEAPQKPVKAVQQVKRDGPIFRLQDALWNATGVYSDTAEQSFAEIDQFGAQRAVEALAEFDRTMAEIKESADMKALTEAGRKQLRDLARDIRTAIQSRVQLHEAAA